MNIREILSGLQYETFDASALDSEVTGVSNDSKSIKSGEIFVAIKGKLQDGHDYILEAQNKGAQAVVTEKHTETPSIKIPRIISPNSRQAFAKLCVNFYLRPSEKIKLIGVTGTNGKTSTAYLLSDILGGNEKCGLMSTVECRVAGKHLKSLNTTPSSLTINSFLRQMLDAGQKTCVMEVSSHALAQQRVDFLRFSSVVFTNLTHDHLDYHKNLKEYYEAKKRLFLSGNIERNSSIINIDDEFGRRLFHDVKGKKISYGFSQDADWRIENLSMSIKGIKFELANRKQKFNVRSPLLLKHNAYNITASIVCGILEGVNLDTILRKVSSFANVPGRMEPVESKTSHIFVDYAHTPDAVKNVLLSMSGLVQGNLVTVIGCGGDRDRTKRPIMGRIASELSDFVIITSDNPRNEDAGQIIEEICNGIPAHFRDKIRKIPDRESAIRDAIDLLEDDDVLLILGKGHEDVQVIGGKKFPFSDRNVAAGFIKRKEGSYVKYR